MSKKINILWFRKDLRLKDNPALVEANLNAKILADINAAIVLNENNFDPIEGAEVFSDLIINKNKYTLMKKSLEKIKVLDANRIIIDTIYD